MAYLFEKDILLQSLRLGFVGAWTHTHPSLSQRLARIQSYCPNLARSFIVSCRAGLLEPTIDLAKTRSKYVSDYNHTGISVFVGISIERTNNLSVKIPTRFAQSLDERDFFSRLQRAYRCTYNANCTNRLCDIRQFGAVRFKTRYIRTFFNILLMPVHF
jgi:hypothetical protein